MIEASRIDLVIPFCPGLNLLSRFWYFSERSLNCLITWSFSVGTKKSGRFLASSSITIWSDWKTALWIIKKNVGLPLWSFSKRLFQSSRALSVSWMSAFLSEASFPSSAPNSEFSGISPSLTCFERTAMVIKILSMGISRNSLMIWLHLAIMSWLSIWSARATFTALIL